MGSYFNMGGLLVPIVHGSACQICQVSNMSGLLCVSFLADHPTVGISCCFN